MRKTLLKAVSCILILTMTAMFPTSCADSGADQASNDTNKADTVKENADTTTIDEEALLYNDLPTGDFGGKQFNILIPEHSSFEFISNDTGEVIDNAVYTRNLEVEEKLNITLNPIAIPGYWSNKDSYLSTAKNSILAADNAYDMIAGYAAYITQLATNNMLTSWIEIPKINLEKPWWNQNIVDEMTIAGVMNFVNGDLSLSSLNYLMVLFFNKQLVEDFSLENPYDLVKAGAWTFDVMQMYCSTVYVDLNGDSKYTDADMYGYASDATNFVSNYLAVFDEPVTSKGDDGLPYLSYFERESFVEKFSVLYKFMRETPSTWVVTEVNAKNGSSYMFENNQILIMPEYIGSAELLRNSDVDFGIIPYPKWSDTQDKYYTTSWDAYNLFCIPTTATELDFIGTVIENMAASSRKIVVPAFYEVALKSKYSRDEASSEMIDIIRDGAVYNFGTVVSPACSNCGHIWRSLVENKNPNLASYLSTNRKNFEKSFEKYLNGYIGE